MVDKAHRIFYPFLIKTTQKKSEENGLKIVINIIELNDFLMEGAKKSKSKVDIFDFLTPLSYKLYLFFFRCFLVCCWRECRSCWYPTCPKPGRSQTSDVGEQNIVTTAIPSHCLPRRPQTWCHWSRRCQRETCWPRWWFCCSCLHWECDPAGRARTHLGKYPSHCFSSPTAAPALYMS